MDKFNALLARLAGLLHVGTDKLLHFLVMIAIAVANVALYRLEAIILPGQLPEVWLAVNVSATVAFVKELGDWLDNRMMLDAGRAPIHGVELADFLWGLAGGLVVAGFVVAGWF